MNTLPDEVSDDTDPPSSLSSPPVPLLRASPSNETLCLILPPLPFDDLLLPPVLVVVVGGVFLPATTLFACIVAVKGRNETL